ncbi:MAG: CinA family protein, partial [Clostridia bacterium]|nr:CinA family protein [Clostridia bacterium]
MIQEVVKICGLDIDTIRLKLSEFLGMGVTFDVEEKCLDAKITMTSAGTRESFDQIKAYVYNAFSDQVYATEDISLHVLSATLLKRSKKVLSVAESLTGGEICSRLTSVPGISENFYEGIVCYNRHSKMDRLGI